MKPMHACRTAFVALVLVAASSAHAAVSCHKINAKGVGQDLGGGQTQSQMIGGGLLNGSTAGSFMITGGAPPQFQVAGTVTFTTRSAMLTVSVAGSFNVVSGVYQVAGPVTASSGKLAGASGMLMFDGLQDMQTGRFAQDVAGLICADLAP